MDKDQYTKLAQEELNKFRKDKTMRAYNLTSEAIPALLNKTKDFEERINLLLDIWQAADNEQKPGVLLAFCSRIAATPPVMYKKDEEDDEDPPNGGLASD